MFWSSFRVKVPIFTFTANVFLKFIKRIQRRWWSNANFISLVHCGWSIFWTTFDLKPPLNETSLFCAVFVCLFFLNLGHINCVGITIIELAIKQIRSQSQKWKIWMRVLNSCVTHALMSEPKMLTNEMIYPPWSTTWLHRFTVMVIKWTRVPYLWHDVSI